MSVSDHRMECLPSSCQSTVDETAIANTLLQCSPANRIWPGQKCKHCEIKGLPCSEATQSRLGRPPNSQASQDKSVLVVLQTVDDSSLNPGDDAVDADYIKLYVAIIEIFSNDADVLEG
jgi:hypothetical protein